MCVLTRTSSLCVVDELTYPLSCADQSGNQIMLQQTQTLLPVLAEVLSPPTEQLKDDTRKQVVELVRFLHKQQPGLVDGNDVLMGVVQG